MIMAVAVRGCALAGRDVTGRNGDVPTAADEGPHAPSITRTFLRRHHLPDAVPGMAPPAAAAPGALAEGPPCLSAAGLTPGMCRGVALARTARTTCSGGADPSAADASAMADAAIR